MNWLSNKVQAAKDDPSLTDLKKKVHEHFKQMYDDIVKSVKPGSDEFKYFRFPGFRVDLKEEIKKEIDNLDNLLSGMYQGFKEDYDESIKDVKKRLKEKK